MSKNNLFGVIRTRMLLDHPFFGSQAMQLEPIADNTIPTLCTDGLCIRYNEEFLTSLSPDGKRASPEQVFVVAHEVMHCSLLHLFRRGNRDPLLWNIAADYALNLVLVDAGLTAPKGVLLDKKWAGMSAEAIYSKLLATAKIIKLPGSGGGKGQPQSGGGGKGQQGGGGTVDGVDPSQLPTGNFVDGPTTGEDGTEQAWQLVAEQAAAVAKAAGNLPGNMQQQISKTHAPKVDWREELREFITQTIPHDYTWTRPNRRFVGQSMYLPGTLKENMGMLILAVDMSGSTWHIQHIFASEVQGLIREARPEKVMVMYWDTRVIEVIEYGPDDTIKLEAKGGGGTVFQPVLDYVEQKGWEPEAMIVLTDLELFGPPVEPSYPTLWAVPEFCSQKAPYGRLVTVPADQKQ